MKTLEIIDKEINTLAADLAQVRKGNVIQQSLDQAESTRLQQGLNALQRVKTALTVNEITKAQENNHKVPLALD